MLDWTTALLGIPVGDDWEADLVRRINPLTGEIVWETEAAMDAVGSHDEHMRLRAERPSLSWFGAGNPPPGLTDSGVFMPPMSGQVIALSGNPSKWLQGHNLVGPPAQFARELVRAVVEQVNLPGLRWPEGAQQVATAWRRQDVAKSFQLDGEAEVYDWLAKAGELSRSRYATASYKGSTVYWQKSSRRWSIKAYGKHNEVLKHVSRDNPLRETLIKESYGILRIEVVMRAMELQDKEMPLNDDETFWQYWEKLTMHNEPTPLIADTLKPRLRIVWELWREGKDLKRGVLALPRNTFYRYRSAILAATGDDISLPPRKAEDKGSATDQQRMRKPWLASREVKENKSLPAVDVNDLSLIHQPLC